jgi:hypothetical protein
VFGFFTITSFGTRTMARQLHCREMGVKITGEFSLSYRFALLVKNKATFSPQLD